MSQLIYKKQKLNILGIGKNKYVIICKKLGINYNQKKIQCTKKMSLKFNNLIKKYSYQYSLKTKIKKIISFYIKIKNYRGIRHAFNYPVRGQRTKTNAKTQKKHRKKLVLKKNDRKKL